MSIASRIQSITAHLLAAYAKLAEKGAEMPQDKNIENLASTIDSISTGGGEWTSEGILLGREPYGDIVINTSGAGSSYAFAGRTGITSLRVIGMTTMGSNMFQNCKELRSVKFTGITETVGGFSGCTKLEIADFDTPTRFVAAAFNGCDKLSALILRSTNIVTLSNISAMANTPFARGKAGGEIYIPKALYDHLGDGTALDYKSTPNWSTIDGYGTIAWRQIEGSEYEE